MVVLNKQLSDEEDNGGGEEAVNQEQDPVDSGVRFYQFEFLNASVCAGSGCAFIVTQWLVHWRLEV